MIKETKYQGYTANTSDYNSIDGELALSLNLINEDDALKPVFPASDICQMPEGMKMIFIHHTATYTHYIIYDQRRSNILQWLDGSVLSNPPVSAETIMNNLTHHAICDLGDAAIHQVHAVGNTLVVIADDGMHYILWKADGNYYAYLGTHLPECPLSFGLQGTTVLDSQFTFNSALVPYSAIPNQYGVSSVIENESTQNALTETVLAQVNKFIATHSTNDGKFLFPFFVRYALRLYDGSLVMHSSPVLMVTTSHYCPQVFVRGIQLEETLTFITELQGQVGGVVFDLDFKFLDDLNSTYQNALQQWSDIVKSVDIFVSAPIYTYNQADKVKGFTLDTAENKGYTISKIPQAPTTNYVKHLVTLLLNSDYATDTLHGKLEFTLPRHSDDKVADSIRDCSNFYLLKSLTLDEVFDADTRTVISVPNDYLQSLTSREHMTDDFDSHDTLLARTATVYNGRLNIAGDKRIASPSRLDTYLPYCESSMTDPVSATYNLCVNNKYDGQQYALLGQRADMAFSLPKLYFYYPDAHAEDVVIYDTGISVQITRLPLRRHAFLNGAVYFEGWTPSQEQGSIPSHIDTNPVIPQRSKLCTSEFENPFSFPVTGRTNVGSGEILSLSNAAKALSQGQFGQFPLYAFTTEGVWALEVSAGGFSARQPITRDVCATPESITQLDSSVFFASDRGIMMLQGSSALCISDPIAAEHPFNILENLPKISVLHSMLGHDADTCLPIKPFSEFLGGCRMIYDYTHQQVIVFNPSLDAHSEEVENPDDGFRGYDEVTGEPIYELVDPYITVYTYTPRYTYAYVFSLKSKLWGMMYSNLESGLNSYPDALAMTQDGRMVSLTKRNTTIVVDQREEVPNVMLVTRPIAFGSGNVQKTVRTVIQHGMFRLGDVKTVLYGSNDLYNWYLVASSVNHRLRHITGTPYRYFRIAAVAVLEEGQSVDGSEFDLILKHTNTLKG